MQTQSSNFSISPDSLKNIPFQMYDKDFTFIVNGKRYKTNRIIADTLSPLLQQLHYTDKSIDEFIINTKPCNKQMFNDISDKDYFEDFLKLGTFQNIEVDSIRQHLFSEYFYMLKNTNEFFRIQPNYLQGLTEGNAIERLILLTNVISKFGESFFQKTNPINEIISFVSSRFESINKEKIKQLDINIIEQIISNKSLKLIDEDSLLQFILNLYEEDHSYSRLFEYVLFFNVSNKMLEKFINCFDIDDINSIIWKSICYRLRLSKVEYFRNSKRYNDTENNQLFLIKEFSCRKSHEFEGIMKYLTDKTGGNIHDNGTIEITTNSIRNNDEHPKNLVDYQNYNHYHNDNKGDAIVCFDFKDKQIQLTSYSIKSNRNNHPDSFNLRNWAIDVSDDGKNWIDIDNHINDPSLDGQLITFNFVIKKQEIKFHRFVRLRQTGDSWSPSKNPNYFWFYFIEFFGKIKIPAKKSLKDK